MLRAIGVTVMTPQTFLEGLGAVAAAIVEASVARLVSANANAASAVTAVVAPSADPVSMQMASAFNAVGGQYTAAINQGAEILGHFGPGVSISTSSHVVGEGSTPTF